MAVNGISTATAGDGTNSVLNKIERRNLKLSLATTKRQTTGTIGYRVLNVITGTHVAYVGTATTTVSGTASPAIGRPWSS